MSPLVEFPQRQHEQFCLLVRQAITAAARKNNIALDQYIQHIYFRGDDPERFNNTQQLNALYDQFKGLIDKAIQSVENTQNIKNSSKAYLCYRIYLHAMTLEKKVLSEAEATDLLATALKEFFYSKGKVLSLIDEVKLINALSLASEQARPLQS